MEKKCAVCGKVLKWTDMPNAKCINTMSYVCKECNEKYLIYDKDISSSDLKTQVADIINNSESSAELKDYLTKIITDKEENEYKIDHDDDIARQKKLEEDLKLQETREDLEQELKQRFINNEVILVTTDYITDHEIKTMIGPVSGCITLGAGIIRSKMSEFSEFFGTQSKGFSRKLSRSRQLAEDLMMEEAKAIGANAVIDIHYQISNFGRELNGILVTGTAVICK